MEVRYKIGVIFFVLGLLIFSFIKWERSISWNDTKDWFPFMPTNTSDGGIIGMRSWLDAPAGKYGFIRNEEDKLVFENGKEIKLWGTNICSRLPFVEAEKADSFADFFQSMV